MKYYSLLLIILLSNFCYLNGNVIMKNNVGIEQEISLTDFLKTFQDIIKHVEKTRPPAKFRDDYTFYPEFGYYKFHIHPAPWHSAKYICELEGAHLAVINSQEEANLLLAIFKSYPKVSVDFPDITLIGFNDLAVEGEYVTILGDLLKKSGFIKWSPNQPDNSKGNENCGSLTRSGGLNDFWCHIPSTFVCEKEF